MEGISVGKWRWMKFLHHLLGVSFLEGHLFQLKNMEDLPATCHPMIISQIDPGTPQSHCAGAKVDTIFFGFSKIFPLDRLKYFFFPRWNWRFHGSHFVLDKGVTEQMDAILHPHMDDQYCFTSSRVEKEFAARSISNLVGVPFWQRRLSILLLLVIDPLLFVLSLLLWPISLFWCPWSIMVQEIHRLPVQPCGQPSISWGFETVHSQ